MAIELKKYKSQVDIKSLDVARTIDAGPTVKAAGQEAIIPMTIVDALGYTFSTLFFINLNFLFSTLI